METSVIIAIITAISGLVGYWFQWKNNKNSDKKKELLKAQETEIRKNIEDTEAKIIKAMETSITDVPGLRLKLESYRKQLKKIIGSIAVILCASQFSGCAMFEKENPVIVGERVFYVKAGDQMTVPELKAPAKQWYLIDDVAMLKVIGIDKPVEKIVTGVTNK